MADKRMVVSRAGRPGPVVKVNCLRKMKVCQAVHGICLYGEKVIICDRKLNSLIEVDVNNGDVKSFVGKVNVKSADRCSCFCCFAQPFLVCCEEKTLLLTGQL